ncbi:hypothetical protein GGTG_07726 [Gaeumannomyces tritici R3-111a-1]|uniref:Uncharacterized protein n=1 Tax=Gaeumannomyces tritici (strain R3-111a-1) TaxID=644352 RepID=J3P2I0_GAET3|nr:hypothetical protein GGTG_07726 [Gaeumannomyces tritici R3-111a-1]EJT73872.1 hypothetical protein GGTG_07726 [Gaeumannomyces tritici R3-111a-1]
MAAHSIYQPLNQSRQEIRLIEITPFDPADKSSVIDCKLHVVSLLDKPDATVNLDAALRQAVRHSWPQIIREAAAASHIQDMIEIGGPPRPEWDHRAYWASMISNITAQMDFSHAGCPLFLRF